MHVLWDFQTLPQQSHRLQVKVAIGTLITVRHGPMLAARIPPHCQSMPPCSTPLSWRAARVPLEDRQAMHVLWDFQTLPQRSLPQPQPRSPLLLPLRIPLQSQLQLPQFLEMDAIAEAAKKTSRKTVLLSDKCMDAVRE